MENDMTEAQLKARFLNVLEQIIRDCKDVHELGRLKGNEMVHNVGAQMGLMALTLRRMVLDDKI